MTTTERKHRTMDVLFALLLFSGCFAHISGDVIKTHSVNLQNILSKFNTLIKLKDTEMADRESTTPVVCVMSVDELNEIENAFVRAGDSLPDSNDVSIQFSSTCTELDKLKTGILKFKNDFKALIGEPISSHSYRDRKRSYELKIFEFKNMLENTKKTISRDRLELVEMLQNEFQAQQTQVIEVLRKLEADQMSLNDANVGIVITQLQLGKLEEAVAAFAKITDQDIQVERIVASVLGSDVDFYKVCRFVVQLPRRSVINGYKALYEQLKKDNQVMDHRIWILASELMNFPEEIKDGGLIEAVMTDVKELVRSNNFDGLTVSLNRNGAEGLNALKLFAPTFVRTVYEENGNSVEKFLTVLKKLTFIRHRLYLINELVIMLKLADGMHGRDMSKIVYELIKLRTVKKPQNAFLQKLIEQNLPDELRDLMYNNLCIQNAENDEYLFAGVPANENQRHVYTAKTQSLNESFYWQVYFTDNGTKVLIKNNKYNEHLYLIDEGNHDDEHVVRSWIPASLNGDRTAEFYLDMLGNGQIAIVNKHFGQVMYSPFDGEPNANNNRPVFSKKYDPKNVEVDSKWIIGICRLDVEYVF